MSAENTELPSPPPFEITPEMQAQLALLTRQAMAQLEALVAALNAAGQSMLLPPPPLPVSEKTIPIVEEPPPEIYTGSLGPAVLWLDPPGLAVEPVEEKGSGAVWSRPMPLSVELARAMPVDLPVIAVEAAATPAATGGTVVEVVDLSGFWSAFDHGHGGEGGMF